MAEKAKVVQEETTEVSAQTVTTGVSTNVVAPMGFEDEDPSDLIVPRVKVVQMLSPEHKDKLAEVGDIIDSLTKTKLNGKTFVPVFKFNNNIWWKDRADGGGMQCSARDGKRGQTSDGTPLLCSACKKAEFDNTKQGKAALPVCTKYINYFGFFAGERMPIILSFAKTNYAEGKKLFSLAKVTMQNMWNFGYVLKEKIMAKNGNEWYIIVTSPGGETTTEDREFAMGLYQTFRDNVQNIQFDVEEAGSSAAAPINVESTEY